MALISRTRLTYPVKVGDMVIKDLLVWGLAVAATRESV